MRKILITLGLCFFTSLLYGQEIIKPLGKIAIEKTLVEKIDARLKIELAEIATTDTILIQKATNRIVNEEIVKSIPDFGKEARELRAKITPPPIEIVKIDAPEIEVLRVKYIDFWKDIPKFEPPTIYVMAIKYLQYFWKDICVGGSASLIDNRVQVVPVIETRLKGEVR